jgi:hypothetical protein
LAALEASVPLAAFAETAAVGVLAGCWTGATFGVAVGGTGIAVGGAVYTGGAAGTVGIDGTIAAESMPRPCGGCCGGWTAPLGYWTGPGVAVTTTISAGRPH